MLNIFTIGQGSADMINGAAMFIAKGRKLGNPYEAWEWMKKKFAPRGDIAKMQTKKNCWNLSSKFRKIQK